VKFTNPQHAKEIDVTEFLKDKSDSLDGLMNVIRHGLDNRRTRDNQTNDTSSRSILVLNVHTICYGGDCPVKWTFVDLAGQERSACLEISEKLYKEALFINESLECLMISSRRKSLGKRIDPSVHILMQMLQDIFNNYG